MQANTITFTGNKSHIRAHRRASVDRPETQRYTKEDVLQLVGMAYEMGLCAYPHKTILDNGIAQVPVMPCGGDDSMAKNYRQRVLVGQDVNGASVFKQVQAQSEQELNDRIVRAYIESGRISEFLGAMPYKPKKKTNFKTYAANWLRVYKADTLKPKTLKTYEGYLISHLYPAFGERDIEELSTADVMSFLSERKHMARKSLRSYLSLLQQVLDSAVSDGMVEKNVSRDSRIVIPSTTVKKRKALTEEQMRDVMRGLYAMENGREKRFLCLLVFLGCRRGEALGLKWEDIDFGQRLVYIRRNVTHTTNAPIIGTPKTKSGERVISFGEHFEELMKPMQDEGFVIGGEAPVSIKAYKTIMKHINERVNLHGATPHVLRHSYLTLLSANGVDMKTLQAVAGHADIQTTMNVYVHPSVTNIQSAGSKMDGILHGYASCLM